MTENFFNFFSIFRFFRFFRSTIKIGRLYYNFPVEINNRNKLEKSSIDKKTIEDGGKHKMKVKAKCYDDLTLMQKDFVDNYIATRNAVESAIKAGYAESGAAQNANKMLREYKTIIRERIDMINNGKIMTIQDILVKLSDIANGVEKDAFGLDTSNQDKLKALELLGKSYQMYTDKVKTDVDMDINVNLMEDNNVIELNGNVVDELDSNKQDMLGDGTDAD